MKNNKKQLARIENLLKTQKNEYQKDFKDLFFVDLKNLLNEFFVLSSSPSIEIERVEKGSKIKIEFTASAIKTFSFLSKEEVEY